ncbi:helix-turn-helix domain-containing protein [Streptomyces chrestomyceticus]|uniref:helix-turn-helix domain-containing protein n=1 Tax=Streptomyces chrestomyceticus TaxID=68185 RepID=UPI003410B27D
MTIALTSPAERVLYRPEEAATALGIGRSLVYEEIRLGRLRTVRIGRRRLIPREYIAQYVELLKGEAEAAA